MQKQAEATQISCLDDTSPSVPANLHRLAEACNTLTRFLGLRDLPNLRHSALKSKYGIDQADVMILFGGTIPFGCEVAAAAWKRNGWRKADKEPALNPDLWDALLQQAARHSVTYQWIHGHQGHAENERCDRLAVEESRRFTDKAV